MESEIPIDRHHRSLTISRVQANQEIMAVFCFGVKSMAYWIRIAEMNGFNRILQRTILYQYCTVVLALLD